jgi:SSS family solute:Na+ symporter
MTEVTVFVTIMAAVLLLGFVMANRRQARHRESLEEWGVAGRAFGNWTTWFLLGGSMYSAYTFIAVPALTYGVGAVGFFAVPFAIITAPLTFVLTTKIWSVARRHGFVTHGEFAGARFGSRALSALVAVTGILATMPYIAVQLISLQAVLRTVGLGGELPLLAAVTIVSICTFRSGLRAPALLSIVKDILLAWMLMTAVLMVAMFGGWDTAFHQASVRLPAGALLLPDNGQLGFLTLVIGSALAIFAYPHALTGMLAAKDQATIRRNAAALPVYCIALALMALLGYFALGRGVTPLDGDLNTIIPRTIHEYFPPWSAGVAYAALSIAALIPAAVMSIAAANCFTRSIYRPYLRPAASPGEEAKVSRWTSLAVKFGAVAFILAVDPAYSVELQLIGGVLILQTVPAVVLGLITSWFHRQALIAGLLTGLATGVAMLYDIPRLDRTGRVVEEHFGGSSWSLGDGRTVYVGLVALAVNLMVTVVLTLLLRLTGVPAGVDATLPGDYDSTADDPGARRLDGLLDGLPRQDRSAAPSSSSSDDDNDDEPWWHADVPTTPSGARDER